jgi:multidrug efflux pump subunit AcrA (membrane-fusion protein)
MNSRIYKLAIILVLGAMIGAACGGISAPGGGEAEATPVPTVISDVEIVSEGRLVPRETEQLAFFANGQVEEVLVDEGDQVSAGDVVARLGNREEIEAAIAGAEAELLAANTALDDLNENNDIAKANALQAIASAERAVRNAQYQVDNYTIPQEQQGLTAQQAVDKMKTILDEARQAFEPYKYYSSGNSTRKDLKEDLDTAQSDYNNAVKRLEYETGLENAKARLEEAKRDYETLKNGPDPKDVDSANSRIDAAKANLAAAKASLDNLDLVASIDGTVVTQDLIIGQNVTAGQPVMQIADFSQMYAETDDLTEIEVVDVSLGQKVTVVADALPDLVLNGTVDKISDVFEEKRGDITYTVRILLDDMDPRLRWGMTVVITFKQ